MTEKIKSLYTQGDIKVSDRARRNRAFAWALVKGSKLYDSCVQNRKIEGQIDQAIQLFHPESQKKDILTQRQKIWKDRELYLIDPEEYYLYNFAALSDAEKHEFVGNREKELLCRILNRQGKSWLFTDKWKTYQKFSKYYHRHTICITKEAEKDAYLDFLQQYSPAMCKVTKSSRGRGVFMVDGTKEKAEEGWKRIQENLSEGKAMLIEEYIRQAEDMAVFHPQSVNTVRFTTFLDGNSVIKMMCVFRMGMGASNVDNGGAGGICAAVDLNTGICAFPGTRENGQTFTVHPDTGIRIVGFQIPLWRELNQLVEELAWVVPEQLYVGWDLALTESGWVMVEGNSWSQFEIAQMSSKQGMREIVRQTFGKRIKTERIKE